MFIKELINNEFYEIYPRRTIESIYFDNYRNFSYLDSEEGIVPRKKLGSVDMGITINIVIIN